jgi:predicted MFS family arabinose efflux permease
LAASACFLIGLVVFALGSALSGAAGDEQARALGVWAGISALALGVGPPAGGALVEIDWRVIFWINLPVAAVGFALTAVFAPESHDPGSGTKIDFRGLAALSVGLTAVVLALVQARSCRRAWRGLAVLGLASLYVFGG